MTSGHLDLVARDVSVQFEGLKALSSVTLAVPRGRITGLIGPNGAGKTTLINVLTGFQRLGWGTVELEGETVNGIAAHKLRHKGVARTFQSGRLFRELPVLDNLEVTGVGLGLTRRDAIAEAERVMDWLGISHLAAAIAGALPYTDERRVAIGRAIMCNPRYLLLDEPAAGMSEHEGHDLAGIIKRIAGEIGVGVLLIEHNIGLVLELCERIFVLDSGEIIEVGPPEQIRNSDAVRHAYMGTQRDEIIPALAMSRRLLHDIAGRRQRHGTIRTLDRAPRHQPEDRRGRDPVRDGPQWRRKVDLPECDCRRGAAGVGNHYAGRCGDDGSPTRAIARRGFSLVPEGRNVFGALTIEENLKVGAGMRTDKQNVAGDLESVYREFPMLAERRHTAAGMLSGGQQQMLVIGRALMAAPRLMAIDEPSLGLAPKIIDQVYENLMRLRAQRKLTLLIVEQSSTRAMMTGGRMILMRGGRIVLEGEAGEMVKDERLKQAYFGFGDH